MIELAFVVCLRFSPALCEERSIPLLGDVGLMGCMMEAQPQLAAWIQSHPDRQVARWRCQPLGAEGERA